MVGSSFPLQGDLGFDEEESTAGSEFNLGDLSDSIADSFLDFDYIKHWIEDNPEPHKGMSADLGVNQTPLSSGMANPDVGPAGFGYNFEDEDVDIMGMDEGKVEVATERGLISGHGGLADKEIRVEEEEIEVDEVEGDGGLDDKENKVEEVEVATERGLVSGHGGDGDKSMEEEKVNGVFELKSEVLSSSSSESSSSSSDSESESSSDESDDDDDDKQGVTGPDVELEEGEILSHELEEMIGWSDDEDGTGTAALEAQRSKNELTVLPPVPPVTATLQPHHQILPVGVVLSVLGAQVIVEGVEKHSPLNEGSILWITKSGTPLGIVDEIFGPVKNPYYIVRYNSESEVPSGIEPSTPISFVPEFADHVLNDKSLYQKGYDRSGPNDEEVLEDEEFSDDEKEAEYKKMLKNKKRGKNDGNNLSNDENKFTNRSRNWNSDSPNNNTPRHKQSSSSPMNQCAPSPRPPQAFAPQPFPQFGAFPGGPNGMMPFQQSQNGGLPQMAPNGMPPMMQQMMQQQFFQMPMDNRFPLQQQMNGGPNMAPNQPGFGSGPPFMPWGGQNPFMGSPFGMGMNPFMNVGQQAPPPGFQQGPPPPGFQQQGVAPPSFQQQGAAPPGFQQQGPPPPGFQQLPPQGATPALPPFQQQAPGPVNTGQEAPPNMQNPSDSQQKTAFSGKQDSPQSFNRGNQSGGRGGGRFRGGKPHRRGGGRFRGGRGGGQNSS